VSYCPKYPCQLGDVFDLDSDWDPRPLGKIVHQLFFEITASSGWGGGRKFSSVTVFDRPDFNAWNILASGWGHDNHLSLQSRP
jgi:hypothetical protein